MLEVKFKKLRKDAITPEKANSTDAGFDLFSVEDRVLHNSKSIVIGTGIAIEIPDGYFGMICSRSGLAAKESMFVVNSPGIIDSGYRGELKIILSRIETTPENYYTISKNQKIAQLIILPIPNVFLKEVEELSNSDRGEKGLGSTG